MKEFLTQPGVYECALFMSGIFFYKIASFLLGLVHMYKYYQQVGNSAFNILISTYVMALAGLEHKEHFLRKGGMDETEVANLVREDKQRLEEWKNISLRGLYNFAPGIFNEIHDEVQKSIDKEK